MRVRGALVVAVLSLALGACRPGRDAHPWPSERGEGWHCAGHQPVGDYESTCTRPDVRNIDTPLFKKLAWCGEMTEGSRDLLQDVAACFRIRESETTGMWVCMARMEECEATRKRLIARPASLYWFKRALLGNSGCIEKDETVSAPALPAPTACDWYD